MGLRLSALYLFPVKSLAGIAMPRAEVDRFGLRFDRRWMLVDPSGAFLTQRTLPRMCLIRPHLEGGRLYLNAAGMPELAVPPVAGQADCRDVTVWGDRVCAQRCGPQAAGWLSEFLGTDCELVYFPEDWVRAVDPGYGGAGDRTAFSDGFPFLLISEASLGDLNDRLGQPLPMLRFRPNLVVAGCPPYAEDGWRRIRIGRVGFRIVKPCSRCAITTVDPESAMKGGEPLKTLSRYRRSGQAVYFGQNAIQDGPGILRVGEAVEVVER